jgi:hypothetical protein
MVFPTKFRFLMAISIICVLSLFGSDLKAYSYHGRVKKMAVAVVAKPHINDSFVANNDSLMTKTEAPKTAVVKLQKNKTMAVVAKPHINDSFVANNDSAVTKTEAPKTAVVKRQKNKQWDPETVRLAQEFVHSRRQVYHGKDLLKTWKMRGVGWAFTKKNIVLAAQLPHNPKPGRNVIEVFNVLNTTTVDCDKYDIWVRASGPEIFAGSAQAVLPKDPSESCHWEFPFVLQKPGTYRVEAKLLYYNAPVHHSCKSYNGDPTNLTYPTHAGFIGFKFYIPAKSCCEACSRLAPDCRYWATPPQKIKATRSRNGCELYFDEKSNPDAIPESYLIANPQRRRLGGVPHAHGPPDTSTPTAYHVGCGWDFWMTLDFPCLSGELDDAVFQREVDFTLVDEARAIEPVQKELPLCTLDNELFDRHSGRWVREAWLDIKRCPRLMGFDPNRESFEIIRFDGTHPHCWHRDDFSVVGQRCLEMNCRFIKQESKWRSHLHEETKFFGYWKNYDCDYMEYTNLQLQQCIDTKKIGKFKTEGRSISEFLNEYLIQRMENINLYKGSDAKTVILDTLSLLHNFGPDFAETLKARPNVGELEEIFWVTGFYLSSEREPGAIGPAVERYSRIAYDVLQSKGYKMLQVYDLSAAFTFDTATQSDGMHIVGPPMKMAITKLFHHLCGEVVEGSRLG